MDTSETYIKMADCPEIQEGWKPERGDWCNRLSQEGTYPTQYRFNTLWEPWLDKKMHSLIWLPRQDQLQEMVARKTKTVLDTLRRLNKWMESECIYQHIIMGPEWIAMFSNDSMEQLWLAFVMHELHKKEDW